MVSDLPCRGYLVLRSFVEINSSQISYERSSFKKVVVREAIILFVDTNICLDIVPLPFNSPVIYKIVLEIVSDRFGTL